MKKEQNIVSLVAHVTIHGLESLERGRIDLPDSRLDGMPGTVQLELHTDHRTAHQMEVSIMAVKGRFGKEAALRYLDTVFIEPWRVKVALVTSGDVEVDSFIKDKAREEGHSLAVATEN